MPEIGMVQPLTPIRDCGAIVDRDRVHWSIQADNELFAHATMDCEDRNSFKPYRIWEKVAKKRYLVQQEQVTGALCFESPHVSLLYKAALQANEPRCSFDPSSVRSDIDR